MSPAITSGNALAESSLGPGLFRSYRTGAIANTFNQYTNVVTGEYSAAPSIKDLEIAVSQLYARLLASQEPLGSVFDEALQSSLWDLYEA